MRAPDESRSAMVPYPHAMSRRTGLRIFLCAFLISAALGATLERSRAAASVVLASGTNETRTTIPVTIDGQRASCVLDTGSSAMLVSPALARAAGLTGQGGTFEVAPDGRSFMDRQTSIARFAVAGFSMHDVPALISSNLSGYNALCGYDFFTRFPSLIDRAHRQVTLFPAASALAHLRCLPVDLSPRVPLATVEINGTWLNSIVLDSGMAGGGALWDGVRTKLRQPLVTDANYLTNQAAVREGFACGASAFVRYAASTPRSEMPICTEPRKPDGYNGIIETNLPSVHAMAVDYPHRRICFDVADLVTPLAASRTPGHKSSAWSRFEDLRPPR